MIRDHDDTAAARERLMSVFDLSQAQADYILEMQLRRLTRSAGSSWRRSRRRCAARSRSSRRSSPTASCCGPSSPRSWREVAQTFGTPRRTVLLESAGTAAVTAAAAPARGRRRPVLRLPLLQRAARPHHVRRPARLRRRPLQARRGRLGRPHDGARHDRAAHQPRPRREARRAGAADAAGLGQRPPPVGLQPGQRVRVARAGRAGAGADLARRPTGPASRSAPGRASSSGSTPRCSTATSGRSSRSRTATRSSAPPSSPAATRRSASSPTEAQLLHFAASLVRPQGRSGGGMAGVKLGDRRPRRRSSAPSTPTTSVVVTASGSATALPGTEPGSVKVTPFAEYPAKGRATGGVRCHRFLKGEDALVFAWAGTAPARAAAAAARPSTCPRPTADATAPACPGSQPIAACAGPGRRPARSLPVWKADRMPARRTVALLAAGSTVPCSP